MIEVTEEEYKGFAKANDRVIVGKNKLAIGKNKRIKEYQPVAFELEKTNIWSFPKRGDWATHQSNYRGNWAPQIVRNVVLRYSKPNETVLDQMCGSGTTLIECKLLGRNAIGLDINKNAVMISRDRLNFNYDPIQLTLPKTTQRTFVGDARNLNLIEDNSIDLIATHPPYANIIAYSNKKERVIGDISYSHTLVSYLNAIKEIAQESYRVLKSGRYCAVLIGDTRKHRHHVPIAFRVMECFFQAGFILKEDIIKYQWKTKQTREKWQGLAKVTGENWVQIDKEASKGRYTDFYLLSHEHLFVFRKLSENEKINDYRLSKN